MKVLQFLNPPPPIGGVTISVKNLHDSLSFVGVMSHYKKDFDKNSRYDVGHVHDSNKYKRLISVIFLKFFCRKTIFTVHGLWLDHDLVNRLTISLADGVIFLNRKLYEEWIGKVNTKLTVLPSLYREGAPNPKPITSNINDKTTLLLYSHARTFKLGQEVYGIEFALNALLHADKDYKIILVDLDAGYSDYVKNLEGKLDILYYPHPVNFADLISKCDIYLRPTCMDGSSLAVQEALLSGKRVVASDVVDRGSSVDTYEHLNEKSFLETISENLPKSSEKFTLDSVRDYVSFISDL